MASKFFSSIAKGSEPTSRITPVAGYKVELRFDSREQPGLTIFPVDSDGTAIRSSAGQMWIRLAEGPEALRAFRDALPTIQAALVKIDNAAVEAGEWKAAPTPKAQATAARPTPPAAAPKPKSVLAKGGALDSALGDLPF